MPFYNSEIQRIRQILRHHDGGNKINPSIVRELFDVLISCLAQELYFGLKVFSEEVHSVLMEVNCTDRDILSAIEFLWYLYDIREYLIAQDFCYWVANKEDIPVSADEPRVRNLFADSKVKNGNSFVKIFKRTLLDGNFDFLAMLIKLGKCFEFPTDFELTENNEVVMTLARLRSRITPHHHPTLQGAGESHLWQSAFYFYDIYCGIDEEKLLPGQDPKRKSIVKLCISTFAYSLRNGRYKDRYAKCLRLAFQAAAEPVVSSHEVERYLRELRSDEEWDDFINGVTRLYVEFMPESIHMPSPRSLKDLSCFQMRKGLRKAGYLPEEIPLLDLPKELVECLKLYLH